MSVEDIEARHRASLLRALRHRRFALLWSGRSLSGIGESVMMVALAWLVYDMTASPAAMGEVMMLFRLPWLALLLVGGLLADRVSRRSIMLVSDVVRGLVVATIAVLAVSGQTQLWHVQVLAVVFGAAGAFFNPAYLPLVPQLVPKEDLVPANSLGSSTWSLAQIFGPLLGAALITASGTAAAFAFDAITLGTSALCLLAVGRVPPPEMPGERASVLADLREGFGTVAASTWLWLGILIWAVMDTFAQGAMTVVLPQLVRERLGGEVSGLGAVQSAVAVGVVGGTIVLGQVGMPKWRGIWFYLALATRGTMIVGLGLVPDLRPAMALGLVFGTMMGMVIVIWESTIQELVPLHVQGRVRSIDMGGSFALTPLGFFLAGQVAEAIGPSETFVVAGLAAALVSSTGLLVPSIRRFGVKGTVSLRMD